MKTQTRTRDGAVMERSRQRSIHEGFDWNLMATHEDYRASQNKAPDAVITVSLQGDILDFNEMAERLYGYEKAEVVGKKIFILDPDPERGRAFFKRVMDEGPVQGELPQKRKDGSTFPGWITASLLEMNGQRVLQGFVRDATTWKEKEAAVETAEAKLRSILEVTPNGIAIVDTGGVIRYSNPANARMLGYEMDELVGMDFSTLVPEEKRNLCQQCFQSVVMELPEGGPLEIECVCKDGARFPAELRWNYILDNDRVVGVVTSITDLTECKRRETEIRRLQAFSERTIDNAPVGIMVLDKEGRILSENPAMKHILGVPEGEDSSALGQSILGLKNVREAGLHKTCKRLIAGNRESIETEFTSLYGKSAFLRLEGVPICNEKGDLEEAVVICQDITERKRAEEKLRENEEKTRAVLDAAVDGVITIDERGVVQAYNPAAGRIFGYEADEVIGRNVTMLMPPPFGAEHDRHLKGYLKTGEGGAIGIDREVEGARKDGTVFPIEITVSEVVLGERRMFTAIVRNITERKAMEAALRESEGRYRQLFDLAPVGYHEIDGQGRITRVNKTELEMLGYTADEMLGRPVWNFIVGKEKSRRAVKAKLSGEQPIGHAYERNFRRKDGSIMPALMEDRFLQADGGEIVSLQATIQDITERKKVEAAKKKRAAEVIRLQGVLLKLAKTDITNYEPALKRITRMCARTLDIERVAFWALSEDRREAKCESLFILSENRHDRGIRIQHPGIPEHITALESSRILALKEARAHPVIRDFEESHLKRHGITSIMSVPVRLHGNLVGVMSYEHAGAPRDWTQAEQDFATSIADMVSLVLEASERKRAQEALVRKLEQTRGLRELVEKLNRAASLDEVYPTAVHGLMRILGADRAAILLRDPDGIVRFKAWKGLSAKYRRAVEGHVPWDQGDLDAQPVCMLDISKADLPEDLRATILAEGIRACAFIPLIGRDRIIGKLMVYYNRPHELSMDEMHLCKVASENLATAIERLISREMLRKSEHKYRTLLDQMNDGLMVADADERVTMVNPRMCEIMGCADASQLLGRTTYEFLDEDNRAVLRQALERRKAGAAERYELTVQRLDGGEAIVGVSASPVLDDEGAYVGSFGILTDLTEEKELERIETALYAISEAAHRAGTLDELYRAIHEIIVELIPVANFYIAAYDRLTDTISWPYFVDEETPIENVHPRNPSKGVTEYVLKLGQSVLLSKGEFLELEEHGEIELRGKMPLTWLGVPLKLEEETIGVLAVQSYTRSVTLTGQHRRVLEFVSTEIAQVISQKRAEEALKQSEDRYRRFFEEDLTGDYVSTADGRLLACNPAFARIFGFASVEEALACDPSEIYPESETRAQFLDLLRQEGRLENHEAEYRRKDGAPIFVIENAIGTYDDEGELADFRGYVFDITERKRLEEEFNQSQKMEAIGTLAAGVAHDFNNLLTSITGYSDLLLFDLEPGDYRRADLEEIKHAADRAAQLTQQLLLITRKQMAKPRAFDLNATVSDMQKLLRRLIGENIELNSFFSEGPAQIKADPGQTEQVIINLAVNARDAMPRGGKLTIETALVEVDGQAPRADGPSKPGRYVALTVSDTGQGMDAETRSRIFEPFFTTKEQGKGTGLGLSTVYGIIKQAGGNIDVHSEPGQGATFRIYFPSVDEIVDAMKSVSTDVDSHKGHETILVVEDDDGVRALAHRILHKYGYNVLEAGNPGEALLLLERHGGLVDLMLTDVVMPLLDGRLLAQRVMPQYPDMKVLFMSGFPDRAASELGELDPGGNFIQKPFSTESLVRKVREVLDAKQTAAIN